MSKKVEKEPVKQKKNKKEISEKEGLKGPTQTENKDTELKKLEEEVARLKNDKLMLLAELDNKRKDFQRQMEQVYKFSNKKLVS